MNFSNPFKYIPI